MADKNVDHAMAVIGANYIKRWLEGNVYEAAFFTPLGENLKSLDRRARYGIEFGLNLLAAYFDKTLAADTTLKRLIKEIGLDAAPEISKRLLNGDHTAAEKSVVEAILSLEAHEQVGLLRWLYDQPESRRADTVEQILGFGSSALARFALVDEEAKAQLLGLMKPATQSGSDLSHTLARGTERLRELRTKLRRRRGI